MTQLKEHALKNNVIFQKQTLFQHLKINFHPGSNEVYSSSAKNTWKSLHLEKPAHKATVVPMRK